MSTARRRRRGDRPPLLGEDGLHADPTRNGLTAPEEIGAARSLVHAYRTHGHMAARLDPLGSDPIGDPGTRPGLPRPRRRRARAHPGRGARSLRPGRDARRRAAAPARDLRGADRVPDRAPLGPSPAALAARGDRVRRLHAAAAARRAAPHPRPPAARRDVRALPPPRVPRREAVLDRGPRRDGADARRDDHAGRAGRHRGGRARHGAPRAPERARPRAAPQLHVDHGRVRGPARRRRPRGAARSAARATSSTTTARAPSRAIDVVVREAGEVRVEQRRIDISLLPNPSHLEFVNPVVAGRVRALQTDQERSDAPADTSRALAISIHGDAAFPGQGVVAETLNLQSLRRLPRRRHAARDREQPGRLHDGRARLALDALLVRPRQGLRHPDHPRQRRRRRRLPQRRAPGDGVPRALRPRRR